jgi:hypothetical protein
MMEKKHGLFLGFAILAAAAYWCGCGAEAEAEDGANGNSDGRAVLTAGVSQVAFVAGGTETAVILFTGAAGLALDVDDFAVTGGGAVDRVEVYEDQVLITVAFQQNTSPSAKIYIVSVAEDSEVVRGSGSWTIIHWGIAGSKATRIALAAVADSKFGNTTISAITYVNGTFVAGGSDGNMAYSTNGTNWEQRTVNTFSGSRINAITYGEGTFVVGGTTNKLSYFSNSGNNWEDATPNPLLINQIYAVTHGGDIFVAGGWGGMVYSADGKIWAAVADSTFGNSSILAITYVNSTFVAVGDAGKVACSADGENWTAVEQKGTLSSAFSIRAITYGGDRFVAGGYYGQMAYSEDGKNWTAVEDSTFDRSNIHAVTYGGGRFVAGGQDGKMAYSADGENWTAVEDSTFGNSTILAVTYGGGRFVAVGESGKIAYSNEIE